MFRSPHTTQERRRNECEPGFARAKRAPGRLPTIYDDVYRANARVRSWKGRKRRKQWER